MNPIRRVRRRRLLSRVPPVRRCGAGTRRPPNSLLRAAAEDGAHLPTQIVPLLSSKTHAAVKIGSELGRSVLNSPLTYLRSPAAVTTHRPTGVSSVQMPTRANRFPNADIHWVASESCPPLGKSTKLHPSMSSASGAGADSPGYAPGELLVKFRPGSRAAALAEVESRVPIRPLREERRRPAQRLAPRRGGRHQNQNRIPATLWSGSWPAGY